MKQTVLFGLLAALFQTAAAKERPPLLCGGVEPFWSLEINEEDALYSAPDTDPITYSIPLITKAEGRDWPRVLTLLAQRDTAIAVLRPLQCSDTMSDIDFDWTIDILTQRNSEAIALTGCCRLRPTE